MRGGEPTMVERREIGWIEVVGGGALGVTGAAVVIGVTMTLFGSFDPIATAVGALIVGGWLTRPLWTAAPSARARLVDALAILLVLAWVGVNAMFAGQHVFAERDPGVYVNAGWWLTDHGSSSLEFAPGLVDSTDGSFSMSGFWDDRGDGALSTQFPDGLPVLLAIAGVAGAGALFLAPVVLGGLALLALYLFATLFIGRWWALLAAASLGANLVHAHFSRDAYTEPLTLALLFGGGWLLGQSFERPSLAWPAGLVLGAGLLVRIDVLLVLLVLPLAAAAAVVDGAEVRTQIRRVAALVGALLALGSIHLVVASPRYWQVYDRRLVLVTIVLGMLVLAASVVARWRTRIAGFLDRHGRVLAGATTWVLLLAFAYVWVIRPLGPDSRGPTRPFIGELLAREGHDPDPTRTMSEMTGVWLWWYLGPVLVAGLAGLVAMARRIVLRRQAMDVFIVGSVLVASALYLLEPSINPEQLWAMRRFLPVVIPGLTVLAAWWLGVRLGELDRLRFPVGVLAAGVMLFPAVRLAPLAESEPLEGAHRLVLDVCDALPERPVLFAGGTAPDRQWGPPLRVFCDVPVIVTTGGRITALMNEAREQGLEPLWFGSGCRPDGDVVVSAASAFPIAELTVTRPPEGYDDDYYGITVVRPDRIEPFSCAAEAPTG